jgi:hypothetical protein
MMVKLDVAKVLFGAFLVPWWNRRAFVRALAIPFAALVTLSLAWYFGQEYVPALANWFLYALYVALFALFAITCHRLVLLDPPSVAPSWVPRWSRRETRFFLWLLALGLISTSVILASATVLSTLILNLRDLPTGEPRDTWFVWILTAANVPALYLFARLCLVFPATAVDRKVNLQWAWALSANNGWRLFLIVAVLPWIIAQCVKLLYRSDAGAIETVVLTFLGYALMAVEVAALSLSYRELTKREVP